MAAADVERDARAAATARARMSGPARTRPHVAPRRVRR